MSTPGVRRHLVRGNKPQHDLHPTGKNTGRRSPTLLVDGEVVHPINALPVQASETLLEKLLW